MRKIILSLIVLVSSITLSAQKATPENKVFNLDVKKSNPKDSTSFTKNATLTSNTAIYSGIKYPVYTSKNGKLFVILQSKKTGNYYKRYLPS